MARILPMVMGLILLVSACSSDGATLDSSTITPVLVTPSTEIPTTLPGRSASTATTTVPPPIRFNVEPVLSETWSEGAYMTAVAVGGPGLVAGGMTDLQTGTDAAIWTSRDGRSWTRVSHDPTIFGDAATDDNPASNQIITDLTSGPLGVLAVGASGRPGDYDAAIWVSSDGYEWDRISAGADFLGGPGDQIMRAVVQTRSAAVAVGQSDGSAAVWVSTDGRSWTPSPIGGSAGQAPNEPSAINDVAVGGPGLVAVGWAGFNVVPAVWLSPDGSEWTRLPAASVADLGSDSLGSVGHGAFADLAGSAAIGMASIAVGDSSMVAVGTSDSGPLVWISPDGFEWSVRQAAFDDLGEDTAAGPYDYLKRSGSIRLGGATWTGDVFVAFGGYDFMPTGSAMPAFLTLWASADGGGTWFVGGEYTMPLSDSQLPRGALGLVQIGTHIVLAGVADLPTGAHPDYGWMTYSTQPAVWIADVVDG